MSGRAVPAYDATDTLQDLLEASAGLLIWQGNRSGQQPINMKTVAADDDEMRHG